MVAWEPRPWRQIWQSRFGGAGEASSRRRKSMDRKLKRRGILMAMILLMADVTCYVIGITSPMRQKTSMLSVEEKYRIEEFKRIKAANSKPNQTE